MTAGAGGDDRHLKQFAQLFQVDFDFLLARFIHQINTDDDVRGHLENLKDEVEVPLQRRCVADYDRYSGFLETDEFAGDRFLSAVGDQGIRSRQVDQRIVRFLMPCRAFRQRDGFPRPVAGVLVHAGQLIEHGAFADIGIAGQRDQNFRVRKPEVTAGFRTG